MAHFTTEYHLNGARYVTALFAPRDANISWICSNRGMGEIYLEGEKHEPPLLCSDLLAQWRWPEALHAACWLGMVGHASGRVREGELLHDQGLIHSISHILTKDRQSFDNLTDKLRYLILLAYWNALKIERRVPGFVKEIDDPTDMSLNDAREPIIATSNAVKLWMPDWWEANRPD